MCLSEWPLINAQLLGQKKHVALQCSSDAFDQTELRSVGFACCQRAPEKRFQVLLSLCQFIRNKKKALRPSQDQPLAAQLN